MPVMSRYGRQRSRTGWELAVRPKWPMIWRENTVDYLSTRPWFLNFLIFVFGPLVFVRLLGFYYMNSEPHWRIAYAYNYSVHSRMLDLGALAPITLPWSLPWPDYNQGRLGWYRQGLREVSEHRTLIETLTEGNDLGIVLAAAIANQGNSYQRPFGWSGLERVQVWLGRNVEWPWPEWHWLSEKWLMSFEEHSVGIGQITPSEVYTLGYQPEQLDLLRDEVSLELMLEKLESIRLQTTQLGLASNDAFILMLIGNNSGFNTMVAYDNAGRDIQTFLARNPRSRLQLAKMATYIHYLHTYRQWPLPPGIDWDAIWRLVKV